MPCLLYCTLLPTGCLLTEYIYNYYLSRILNITDIFINGHIFEINQCAHCIRVAQTHNLKFEFGDPNREQPDFLINGYGFEITSTRYTDASQKSKPSLKVLRKFREKNKKPYANGNTILIKDINQLSYHVYSKSLEVSPTLKEVRQIVANESKFGLVLNFVEWIEEKDENVFFKGTVYDTYGKNCTAELRSFVNQYFIKGTHKFTEEIMVSPN